MGTVGTRQANLLRQGLPRDFDNTESTSSLNLDEKNAQVTTDVQAANHFHLALHVLRTIEHIIANQVST